MRGVAGCNCYFWIYILRNVFFLCFCAPQFALPLFLCPTKKLERKGEGLGSCSFLVCFLFFPLLLSLFPCFPYLILVFLPCGERRRICFVVLLFAVFPDPSFFFSSCFFLRKEEDRRSSVSSCIYCLLSGPPSSFYLPSSHPHSSG